MSGAGDASGPARRKVLFLQGPLSPLFRLVGQAIRIQGHDVLRINLCAGDWLHWHGAGCYSFRGRLSQWEAFIETFLKNHAITDLVLHGDQRVYHRIAIACAKPLGIQIAATELGYLRPGWMTLERNGLSTLSHFPDDPALIRDISENAGDIDFSRLYPGSFYLQTIPDVIYNLTNVFFRPFYPHFQRHTIYAPIPEYIRGALRLVGEKARSQVAESRTAKLVADCTPFFVVPLQLEGDFQLRRHSSFKSFADVVDVVFASFSKHAPEETHLVLKSHPLDVGYENWPDVIARCAATHGIENRVHFLDGGGLGTLFAHARGIATLNSTAGLEALQAGVPVKTLVPAHFDIQGLTHSGSLDGFWSAPKAPDPKLVDHYVRALAATIQVRGSIHNAKGVPVAAANIAGRILSRRLNEPDAFVDPPPRLERARELGVQL